MQNYKKTQIAPEEVLPTARRMREAGYMLVMIHGYVDKEGKNVIAYEYAVGDCVESYQVTGAAELPSIAPVYDAAAEWPERELNELMGMAFTGLDTSQRLFLPENLLDDRGQILVTPLQELRERAQNKE